MRSKFIRLFRHLENLEQLIEYYKQNLSASEIARRFNCHHTTILHEVKKYRITRDESRTINEIIDAPTKYQKQQLYCKPKKRALNKKYFPTIHFPRGKCYEDYLEESGQKLVNGGRYGFYTLKIKR